MMQRGIGKALYPTRRLQKNNTAYERHRFISRLAAGETVEESMELSAEEIKALFRYISLGKGRVKAVRIQAYLLGCSHIFRLLRTLEGI